MLAPASLKCEGLLYRVMYEGSSDDYITLHDINGIDMILINQHLIFEFIKLCS